MAQYTLKGNLEVDVSRARKLISEMQAFYSKDSMEFIMQDAFKRTAGHVRKILKDDVPKEYKPRGTKRITGMVQHYDTGRGSGGVYCRIPLREVRGKINGDDALYTATSTARKMWVGRRGRKQRARYNVQAKILEGAVSSLPNTGKRVHFRVFTGRFKGWVFVRHDKKGEHISRAVGIGTPQMPMNRSSTEVANDIGDYLIKRIADNHDRMLRQMVSG